MEDNARNATGWRKIPELVKEWQQVLVLVAGALAALLTTIGIKAQDVAQIIGYAVALILLAIGGLFAYRLKRKQEISAERLKLRETFENRKLKRTSFRGLYPYQAGDVLPGHHRKREAQTIFTQVTDPEFSFGVVCGDSGCGKTSLLRCALQTYVKEAEPEIGLRVLYISGPHDLIPQSRVSSGPTGGKLQKQLKKLKEAAEQASGGLPLLIIIDQFEDFLIECDTNLRSQLGASLNELLHHRWPMRILCAIRRDYLLDMRDLAPQLPEPLSSKTLFPLTNFTVHEAIDVIQECALRDDVELNVNLAGIIAKDLAEGGYVRPPELQIVCAAVVSDPAAAAYHLRGGAKGILAHYVKNLIQICDDPYIGGQVLRMLCDFSAQTKRDPQTVDQIVGALEFRSDMSSHEKVATITKILAQFETARIVQIESRAPETTFTLVHDYLVNPVVTATIEDEKRISKANELLKYYIAEYNDDQRNRIPLRDYRLIKKYADKSLLIDPAARRLLNSARRAEVAHIAALVLLVLVSTATLLTILNTHRTWEPTVIDRMFPEAGSVPLDGDVWPVSGTDSLVSIVQTTEATHVRLWDMKTGKLKLEKKGDGFLIDENAQFLIVADKSSQSAFALHLPTGKTFALPIRKSAIHAFINLDDIVSFTRSEGVILISGRRSDADAELFETTNGQPQMDIPGNPVPPSPPPPNSPPHPANTGIRIWSILQQKELGFIESATWTQAPPPYFEIKEDRLLAQDFSDPGHVEWRLWNAKSGASIVPFADYGDDRFLDFAVDATGRRFVVAKWKSADALKLQMNNLEDGRLLLEKPITLKHQARQIRVLFSNESDFVILMSTDVDGDPEPLAILNSSNLSPVSYCNEKEMRFAYTIGSRKPPAFVYWPSESGMHVWDISSKPPTLMPGLALYPLKKEDGTNREKLIISPHGDRIIVRRQNWRKELYDARDGHKITDLDLPIPDWGIGYGFDESTLFLRFTDGTNRLYNMQTGRLLAEMNMSISVSTFYDKDCHRVTAWSQDGLIYHYTEKLKILGRWAWPTTACHD